MCNNNNNHQSDWKSRYLPTGHCNGFSQGNKFHLIWGELFWQCCQSHYVVCLQRKGKQLPSSLYPNIYSFPSPAIHLPQLFTNIMTTLGVAQSGTARLLLCILLGHFLFFCSLFITFFPQCSLWTAYLSLSSRPTMIISCKGSTALPMVMSKILLTQAVLIFQWKWWVMRQRSRCLIWDGTVHKLELDILFSS